MDIRTLRYFLTVAELLHFGRAAKNLSVSQPSLSRAVRQLEDEIGVRLFFRTTRSIELTPSGKVLKNEAEDILYALNQAKIRTRRAANLIENQIRISYTEFAIKGRMPNCLDKLRSFYPDLKLSLHFCPSWLAIELIKSGEYDISFVIDLKDASGVDHAFAWSDHLMAVLPSRHPLSTRKSIDFGDLVGEPMVLGSWKLWTPFRVMIDREFKKIGAKPDIAQEKDLTYEIFGLVSTGAGITLYSSCIENYNVKGITYVPMRQREIEINNYLVWNKNVSNEIIGKILEFCRQL